MLFIFVSYIQDDKRLTYEEDTYSKIFNSMKHPVRRKIIGILNETPATYTELLNRLEVETGFLNYHLDFLGELVTKKNGRYVLSDFGRAAFELISGVEAPKKRKSMIIKFFNLRINPTYLSLIFVVILLISNICLIYAYQDLSKENQHLLNEKNDIFKNIVFQSKILLTKSVEILNYTINENQINLIYIEDLRKDLIKLSQQCMFIISLDVEYRYQWIQIRESTDLFLESLEDLDNKLTAFLIQEPNNKDITNINYGQISYLEKIRDDYLNIKNYAFSDEITLGSLNINKQSDVRKAVEYSIKLQIDIKSFRRAFNIGEIV